MPAPTPLTLHVCQYYAADVSMSVRELGYAGVRVVPFPARCGRPPLEREEVQTSEADLVIGGCCMKGLHDSGSRMRLCQFRDCMQLLLEPEQLEAHQRKGSYIISSGWLCNWRKHLEAWGEDPETVRTLMREGMNNLLCLDSGNGPANIQAEMAALGEALGLPWSILPVGREHMKCILDTMLASSLKEAASESDAELQEARRHAADRAMAMEFLGELSKTLHESEVRSRTMIFFNALFGASVVQIHPTSVSILAPTEDYQITERGFFVRIGTGEQQVGTLEVADFAFPEYRAYYLNLALSIAGVCALAVTNARTFRALEDAQASQRLMLNVLDALYRHTEISEEIEEALRHIQTFAQLDAVAVRLARRGGDEYFLRGFNEDNWRLEGDLQIRDAAGQPVLGADGRPRLACFCGHMLSGTLPPDLPERTPRGSFWTSDLQGLIPVLKAKGLAENLRGFCFHEGYQSMALVPITSGNEILGLLQACYRAKGRFDPSMLDLLEGVAGSIALALEQRFAEERLREANQELEFRVRERTTELEVTNRNLRAEIQQRAEVEREKENVEQQLLQAQKLEALGTLAGGIAHDFNNILTPILGFAEMGLQNSGEQNALRRNFEMILKAGGRAQELVRQILLFSRRQGQELESLALMPVIKEGLKLMRASLPSTIEMRTHLASEGARVLANPTSLHQILMNLCTNAGHAMSEHGGVLEVRLDRVQVKADDPLAALALAPGAYVVLQVSDTGCGMTSEVRERIFEPFFTTKGPGKGTGLGLSVVHGLVKTFHGHILVDSEVGRGTSFRIYLPEQADRGEESSAARGSIDLQKGHERVLAVDDDPLALDALVGLLEALGYVVTAEVESPVALERLRQDPQAFDLVITDMTMPRLTGIELAAHAQTLRPDLPVLLCSGYNEGLIQDKIHRAGVRAFLQKPYQLERLAETLRKLITQPSACG